MFGKRDSNECVPEELFDEKLFSRMMRKKY